VRKTVHGTVLTARCSVAMRQERIALGSIELAANVSGDPARPAVLLLHGWPHSKALYDGVVDSLGETFHVLAFDLPTIGDSTGSPPSAEKVHLADLLLTAAERAGASEIVMAGIDVGGMIAFAAARDHGARIRGAIIGNTVVPGLDPWQRLISDHRIWHFAFHAVRELPELLVAGHQRTYFDFFSDFLGSKENPLPDGLRDTFAKAYARPEALKAGFDWYRAFGADAEHNKVHAWIDTPILYFRGDADGRTPDDYVAGLRAAGARRVRSATLAGTAEFTPIEAPDRFADMVAQFAGECLAGEAALA
jgi:pimeloyl-ACP methyl ester carboxylesterase